MKKIYVLLLTVFCTFLFYGCVPEVNELYTDNEAIEVETTDRTIKILQLTDQHLMYGFGANDEATLDLIETLASKDDYDLIVLTGDQTMAPMTMRIYRTLINHMESLEIPWTFIFGNHDNDFCSYEQLIETVLDMETTYLKFKVGPELIDGGYGNFKIDFMYQGNPIYHAYFLDSKNEEEVYTEAQGEYGYLSSAQVAWYEAYVQADTNESVVFMHIPLRQFMLAAETDPSFEGIFNEDKVYAQGQDTGFFDAMVTYGLSKGVFVGHDHLNDFSFVLNDIMLAYGRNSGYSAYGNLAKGGRHIEISDTGALTSYIVTAGDPS